VPKFLNHLKLTEWTQSYLDEIVENQLVWTKTTQSIIIYCI